MSSNWRLQVKIKKLNKKLAIILNKNRIWTKDFILLVISTLLIFCANFHFSTSIAIYAKLISNSGTYPGLITASFYIGAVGMRLVNGTLVQKYGCRKLMLISAGLCTIACFAHNFAGIIITLLLIRVLHGASSSIFSTASGTAVSYIVPKNRIGEGMGYFLLGPVLAMGIGPSIALTIISEDTVSQFHQLFNTAAAICVAALIMVHFMKAGNKDDSIIDETDQKTDKDLPKTFLGFEKGVVSPVIVSFLLSFSYSPVVVYTSSYGLSKGWSNVGAGFTMYALGMLSSRLFAGRLSDRHGPDYVIIPAYICNIIALSIIALSTEKWQLYCAMLILGFCVGVNTPQISVFCILRCTRERRGTATAAFNGALDLGLAVGSAMTGMLINHFGYTFTFLDSAFVGAVALIVYIFTLSRFAEKRKLCRMIHK